MKNLRLAIFLISLLALSATSCKKPDTGAPNNLNTQVIQDFAANVSEPGYNDLAAKIATLNQDIIAFSNNQTDANLHACQLDWYAARTVYEQGEGFLFGPIVTLNIDPSIDTWPVNYVDIDSVLNHNAVFTDSFMNSLNYSLVGFHPTEYLIFGVTGTKTAAEFTTRQVQYLVALGNQMKNETATLAGLWNPSQSGNFVTQFTTAGFGSTYYPTQKAAFQEIVNAISGICEEVGNPTAGKLADPFNAQDSTLQESPFSDNSLTDFRNNIIGAQNAYIGKYSTTQGQSLQTFVKQYNLSLNDSLNQEFALAISALNGISGSYGYAISHEPTQIRNAMTAITNLKNTMDGSVMPLVNLHTN